MRWSPGQRSEDLEDRRAESGMGGPGLPGGGFRLPGGRGLGLGGVLVLAVLSLIFGQDLLSGVATGPAVQVPSGSRPAPGSGAAVRASPEEEKLVDFVSFVLDDVQATWDRELERRGAAYRRTKLVLFRDYYPSACGDASGATGPFYCPVDEKVYIDLGFYDDLRRRFGAPGDFAQAYVLAHEVGHHVQNILGLTEAVHRARQRGSPDANALSVRLELQADCLAGVWGRSGDRRNLLEAGDVEEGLNAAAAVGDDRLQRMATGRVAPESWTHGSSRQRAEWFQRGFQRGALEDCDTFGRTGRSP
jgi:hypothetical protein